MFNIAQRRKKSISSGKKHGKQFVFAVPSFVEENAFFDRLEISLLFMPDYIGLEKKTA